MTKMQKHKVKSDTKCCHQIHAKYGKLCFDHEMFTSQVSSVNWLYLVCNAGGGVDGELGLAQLSLGANSELGDMVGNT